MRTPHIALVGLALLLSGCPRAAVDTGALVGTVGDGSDAPVAGATVTTRPATTTTVTDSTGRFAIDHLAPGGYEVLASKAGFLPGSTLATVTAGDTVQVDVELRVAGRNVAAEMIATSCVCGVQERTSAYDLKDEYGSRLIHVEWHATSDTLAFYWEPFITPASEERRLLYAPAFELGGWLYLDGLTEFREAGGYRAAIDSLLGVPSPADVRATAERVAGPAVEVKVDVYAVLDIPEGTVGVGLVQLGPVPFEVQGDTAYFRNIALEYVVADTLSLTAGTTQRVEARLTIPDTLSAQSPPFHVVDPEDIGVFVIIQDPDTRQVLQAAEVGL